MPEDLPPTDRNPAELLADLMDQAMSNEWTTDRHALGFLRFDGDDVEIGHKTLPGHPSQWLPKLTCEPHWAAVCLSSLGHATRYDIAGGPRQRVRITVAVASGAHCGSGTDYGILRYPDGRTERLSGMQGPMGGMLHRWAARTQAA